MDRNQISALLILTKLGINFEMRLFDERLAVQKSVYLAQALGIHLGHHFSWYLRGPYAPSLTRDVYTANENHDVDAMLKRWKLDPSTVEKLAKLREHLQPPDEELTQPAWLELLASTHFLVDRNQVEGEPLEEAVQSKLEKFGKEFTLAQVKTSLGTLSNLDLLPA